MLDNLRSRLLPHQLLQSSNIVPVVFGPLDNQVISILKSSLDTLKDQTRHWQHVA